MKPLYTTLVNTIEKKFRFDAHYFLSGGFWLTLTQIVTVFFGLITTVIFANALTETEFGLYKYLIGIAVVLSSFSLTGLGNTILQAAAKGHLGFFRRTTSVNFFYTLPIFLISVSTAIYYYIQNNPLLAVGCLLVACLQPLISTFQFTPAFLMGSERFKESTILQSFRVICITLVSLATLYFTQNILWLFTSYLMAHLLVNISGYILFKPTQNTVSEEILKQHLSYAKHSSLRGIVGGISQRADTIIVFTQLGATELATYAIAMIIPEQVKGSLKNFASLLLPKYAQHTEPKIIKQGVQKRSFQLFSILATITLGYIFIAPYVYTLLFPNYQDAVILTQISALSFMSFVLFIPYSILQAQLAKYDLYKITIAGSALQLTSLILLTSYFGLIGAVISKLIYRIGLTIIVYTVFLRTKFY